MAVATVAYDSARTYLNDVGIQMWTNAILLPYLKEAHRDLQLLLWSNGLPVLKEKSAVITVVAGSVNLGVNQPSDLIEPISMKERSPGQTANDWIGMEEKDFEPDKVATDTLVYWCWREEVINLVGASANREVLLRYWKGLTLPTGDASVLGFIFAENFLGPQTAQYAARSVGNVTLANECFEAAKEKIDIIVRTNVKGMQGMVSRRIPYRRFNRSRILI